MKVDEWLEAYENEVVEVRRRCGEELDAVAVAHGERWVVLQPIWDLALTGLSAVRRRDITKVKRPSSNLVARWLETTGDYPAPRADLELDTTADAIESLASISPLFIVHPERRRPNTCHVGVVVSVDREAKTFELHEIDNDAQWDEFATVWRFRDVTRIEIGDKYAEAIATLAGPMPAAVASEPARASG